MKPLIEIGATALHGQSAYSQTKSWLRGGPIAQRKPLTATWHATPTTTPRVSPVGGPSSKRAHYTACQPTTPADTWPNNHLYALGPRNIMLPLSKTPIAKATDTIADIADKGHS